MNEIWKPVPSVNGLLEVSSLGRVRRKERDITYRDGRKGKLKAGVLRCSIMRTGYVVTTCGTTKLYVHRIVAEAFHGEPSEGVVRMSVNHINGIKDDNRPENLEWTTHKRNMAHASSTGLLPKGEQLAHTKYSDKFIQAIRNVHQKYGATYAELSELFGVHRAHISQIIRNKTRVPVASAQ